MKLAKLIIILNFISPFAIGTILYLCRFNPKDERDLKTAKGHLYLMISSTVFLVLLIITHSIVMGIVYVLKLGLCFYVFIAAIYLESTFWKGSKHLSLGFLKLILHKFQRNKIRSDHQLLLNHKTKLLSCIMNFLSQWCSWINQIPIRKLWFLLSLRYKCLIKLSLGFQSCCKKIKSRSQPNLD